MDIEWTGSQQLAFSAHSVVLGILVGFFTDVAFAVLCRDTRRRWLLFDTLSGPLIALFVMFGALIIMDGHLHPLLFLGSFLGMIVEHLTLASAIRWIIRNLCRLLRLVKRIVLDWGKCLRSTIHGFLRVFIVIGKKSCEMMKKH